jgi:hypothetical protein
MANEIISGPEILLRSDDLRPCLFCKDIPVPTFRQTDDVSVRANHYAGLHEYPLVADYFRTVNGNRVRFIELDKHDCLSKQAERSLASEALVLKRNFQPNCPVHGEPMIRFAPSEGTFLRFFCKVHACGLWDKTGGYGKDSGHTLPYYASSSESCTKIGHGEMFVRSVTEDSLEWECPVESCDKVRTTSRNASQA